MVAIKTILVLLFAVGVTTLSAQEIKPRIAGLESNKEYMSLLGRDKHLQERADSLLAQIRSLRDKFVEESDNRKGFSTDILRLEGEVFSLQGERGRLAQRINYIEQEWLIVNMNNRPAVVPSQPDEAPVVVPNNARKYADLTRNAHFSTLLSPSDYATLRRSQRYESVAVQLLKAFEEGHDRLVDLRREYEAVDNEGGADSLMSIFLNRQSECNEIVDSLASTWSYVFDNKTYMYDLLFDKEGRHDMLQRAEGNIFKMRQNIERERGVYLSDALVNYVFQKRCVVDYEVDVATMLGLQVAVDSLARVRKSLDTLRYDYAPIEIKRRYFLNYVPLEFSTKYIYTSKNPMPECEVYENGEMYRIKLGEFAERQPLSKFRGLEPVAYLRSEDGGWIYYAGGYPTVEALERHLVTVKRLGFRSADVAAWIDGTYAGSRDEISVLKSKSYTIEITGVDALPESVRRVIAQMSEGHELSRVGTDTYLVTGFRSREAAELVVRGIESADSSLKVGVTEAQ